jgi:spermidine/putrescine transport system permease protein
LNRLVIWYGELATSPRLTARGAALIALPVLWIAVMLIAPLVAMALWSFATRSPLGDIQWSWSLENFRRLAGWDVFGWTGAYLAIFGRTVLVSTVTTVLTVAISYPLAFFIASRRPAGRYLLLTLVIIPFCTNLVIRTYAWMLMLGNQMPFARLAQWLGLIEPSKALYPSALALYLGMVSNSLPFAVLPLYGNVEKLDWGIVEASQDLYARPLRTFLHAILPQTLPGLSTAVILTFIPAMGAFVIPDILGGGKSWLLGNLIQHQFGVSRDFPFGAAVSLVLTLLTLACFAAARGRGEGIESSMRP